MWDTLTEVVMAGHRWVETFEAPIHWEVDLPLNYWDQIRVDPKYFEFSNGEPFVLPLDWSEDIEDEIGGPISVMVDGQEIVVPGFTTGLVGVGDPSELAQPGGGWWICLFVEVLGPELKVDEFWIQRFDGQGLTRGLPTLELRRWAELLLRRVNTEIAAGRTSPGNPHTVRRRRSDSPSDEIVQEVVALRNQGLSFTAIGERIGKSEPTARRYYKRAGGVRQ